MQFCAMTTSKSMSDEQRELVVGKCWVIMLNNEQQFQLLQFQLVTLHDQRQKHAPRHKWSIE